MVTVNVALVPIQSPSALIRASEELAQIVGDAYVLKMDSLAHCTLAQFDIEDPAKAWLALTAVHTLRMNVGIGAPYAARSASGKLWFGFSAEPAQKIHALHETVLAALALPDTVYHTALHENYFPHFTIGLDLDGSRTGVVVPPVQQPPLVCEVRIGLSGPQYQFEKILF